jgi:hypothetical protein
MNPMSLVCTNTTRFIIPMLFSNSNFVEVLNNDFIDSYSFDYYEPNYDNKIIIVTSVNETPRADHAPIETYQRQNQYCFVYDIPDEFKYDYECISKGKYDLISDKYNKRLLNFWSEKEQLKIKFTPVREMYRVTN